MQFLKKTNKKHLHSHSYWHAYSERGGIYLSYCQIYLFWYRWVIKLYVTGVLVCSLSCRFIPTFQSSKRIQTVWVRGSTFPLKTTNLLMLRWPQQPLKNPHSFFFCQWQSVVNKDLSPNLLDVLPANAKMKKKNKKQMNNMLMKCSHGFSSYSVIQRKNTRSANVNSLLWGFLLFLKAFPKGSLIQFPIQNHRPPVGRRPLVWTLKLKGTIVYLLTDSKPVCVSERLYLYLPACRAIYPRSVGVCLAWPEADTTALMCLLPSRPDREMNLGYQRRVREREWGLFLAAREKVKGQDERHAITLTVSSVHTLFIPLPAPWFRNIHLRPHNMEFLAKSK